MVRTTVSGFRARCWPLKVHAIRVVALQSLLSMSELQVGLDAALRQSYGPRGIDHGLCGLLVDGLFAADRDGLLVGDLPGALDPDGGARPADAGRPRAGRPPSRAAESKSPVRASMDARCRPGHGSQQVDSRRLPARVVWSLNPLDNRCRPKGPEVLATSSDVRQIDGACGYSCGGGATSPDYE